MQSKPQTSSKTSSYMTTIKPAVKPTTVNRGVSLSSSSRSQTLGTKTIAAQQILSEKNGITTFTLGGKISTVPSIARGFSDINVGIGSFKNFNDYAQAAVDKQIAIETAARVSTGSATIQTDAGFVKATAYPDTPFYVNSPATPTDYYNPETGGFQSSIYTPNQEAKSPTDVMKLLTDNKWMIIGGIAALIFLPMLLKGGRR